MHPTLFLPWLHTYGLMMAIGVYVGWWLAARRARQEGLSADLVGDIVLVSIIAGIVGARVLWFILDRDPGDSWLVFFKVWEGGLVFYGGLGGAVVADLAYLRLKRQEVLRVADVLAPSVALGQAFGRVGCFLNGCCFGGPATAGFPLALRFPAFFNSAGDPIGSPPFLDHVARKWIPDSASASLPIHPTQLYTAFALLMIALLVVAATPLKRRHGELLALYCMLHGVSRFAVELVRRDTPPLVLGLKAGQLGAVVVLVAGAALFAWVRLRGKPLPAS